MLDFRFWQEQWAEDFDARQSENLRAATVDYWDKRAEDFSAMRLSNDYSYGRAVYGALAPHLRAESTILDIGAGPGSLVIPFCERGHHVMAVEPSRAMIRELEANSRAQNIGNYETTTCLWQEFPDDGSAYDMVMVSLVLWMFREPWPEIERMERHSKGQCAIIADIPDPNNPRTAKAVDINEFQIFYNMLLSQGRFPEVKVIDYCCERTVEQELQCQTLMYEQYKGGVTNAVYRELEEKVLAMAVNGSCLIESRSAIIHWKAGR